MRGVDLVQAVKYEYLYLWWHDMYLLMSGYLLVSAAAASLAHQQHSGRR